MTKKQRLELTWVGKDDWAAPEPRILVEKEVYQSEKKGITDNLLIHGDNLLGLKSLEKNYTGKIKCIYIDPPYNTKSCFVHYDDSFEHSLWLNMMKERLVIMQKLLTEDGSIWISIDDEECHYLKVLCDEIFGRKNFIAEIIWQKRTSRENRAAIGSSHDTILVYGKTTPQVWKKHRNPLPTQTTTLSNLDNDSLGGWASIPFSAQGYRPNQMYKIKTPTGLLVDPPKGRCWGATEPVYQTMLKEGRVYFPKGGNGRPRIKQYADEKKGLVPNSLWLAHEVGTTEESKKEILALFPQDDPFFTPKPERLIERILTIASNPGDIVLDCFAGSGTTGAVAHKMQRRWIMIEMGEHAETHIILRLQKVINNKDPGGITGTVNWKGGGGFRYCELAPSLLVKNRLGRFSINQQYNYAMLSEAVCLHSKFTFSPRAKPYWIHGYSSEKDFIYVVPREISRVELEKLSQEVGGDQSLLVMCAAFKTDSHEFHNLTVKKIPKIILNKCEWGRDDYSLKNALETEARIANLHSKRKAVG